jgi:hypothetical protein
MCTRALLPLAFAASLLFGGCSEEQHRDVNYGTDAGVGFVPPDAAPRADTSPDRGDLAPDGASANEGDVSDAGDADDASSEAGAANNQPADASADEDG